LRFFFPFASFHDLEQPEDHEVVSERMSLDWQSELEDRDVESVHDLVDVGKRNRISWFGVG
jgi:hypothetical protein